jgi:cell division protease FtsH
MWPLWIILLCIALLATGACIQQRLHRRSGRTKSRAVEGAASGRRVTAGGQQIEIPLTRFDDVAGISEVVDELAELVDYLVHPERYEETGADLPHGFLLVGPPGTGKTLLARAVAGEAGVPFFAMAATEFVETYVGVGASRVRKLFEKARAAQPSIVFIDEIDAVGRERSSRGPAVNEERESTLNQLLIEMDGFVQSSVIVLAATNRPEVLDAALLRPGRFDRHIAVPAPDRRGRSQILTLHLLRRKASPLLDVELLGRRTPGFTGADLANLVNTAARIALRRGNTEIADDHFEEALATVLLGPVRKSAVIAERDRTITAWHETGHALIGLWIPEATDPVQVTILPRAAVGGATWFPAPDDLFMSRRQAEAQLVVAMGGRAAEEMLLGDDYTQGASQDFKEAGKLAERMVTEFGMSSLGPDFIDVQDARFGYLSELVFRAKRELLNHALETARAILMPARAILEVVVEALLEEETLDTEALRCLTQTTGSMGSCSEALSTPDDHLARFHAPDGAAQPPTLATRSLAQSNDSE